jgi:hypothetical protein
MELPTPRRLLTSVLLILGLYAVCLPAWFAIDDHYGSVVAWTAEHVGFPAAGVRGFVDNIPGENLSLKYTLPDIRSGGWGRVRQRLLNFPDMPLAIAGALGLTFLSFRKRLIVAMGTLAVLFVCHVGLVVFSARKLGALLARPDLTAVDLNDLLPTAAESANEFGDVSPIITIVTIAVLAALVGRRTDVHRLNQVR